jgi:hypothetical protein
MKRPGDDTPEPPGGRAAERLRDQMQGRFPEGVPDESMPFSPDETERDSGDAGECEKKPE